MQPQLLIFTCFVTSTAYGVAELTNVALGKPTALSSDHIHSANSTRAVDGIMNSDMSGCFHTAKNPGKREWFMVDLQSTFKVHSVKILNRGDCCGWRLKNFKVVVTKEKTSHPEKSPESDVCHYRRDALPGGQLTELKCKAPLLGDFVYVVFMYEQFMHFCEIQVMAEVTEETYIAELTNVALGKPTALSSDHIHSANSTRAVDGIMNSDMSGCFHTAKNPGKREWFMVDLQSTFKVHSVKILNRGDCCGLRLKNFKVVVTKEKTSHPEKSPESDVCHYRRDALPGGQLTELKCKAPLLGDFVYVVFMYEQFMHFCEIQVMAEVTEETCKLKNVALGKPTNISRYNLSHSKNISKAVDGVLSTNIKECIHTGIQAGENQWHVVDLQGTFGVHSVNILNRGDCCGYRLSNFKVVVTETPSTHPEDSPDSSVCVHHIAALPQGQMTSLNCTDVLIGQFVYLVLMNEDYLHFCEIEVMAKVANKTHELKNVARGKPTAASVLEYSFSNTSKAVDGINSTNMKECFQTKEGFGENPWFLVHLEDLFKVHSVNILNRGDCCGDRLRDFKVFVTENYSRHPENSANSSLCIHRVPRLPEGEITELNCTQIVKGEFVYVVLMQAGPLHFCEIEVMAEISNKICDGS